MCNFTKRSTEKELMDLGSAYYTQEEYKDCLNKLGTIGRWFGGDAATVNAIKQLKHAPRSILDVGCGGGLHTIFLAQCFSGTRVVGIDIDQHAIAIAQENKALYEQKYGKQLVNLSFEYRAHSELLELRKNFDIVTTMLVLHHLSDTEIVDFLRRAQNIARVAIIVNDLQRNLLAYCLFWLVSPFFRNRLIRYDGLLSIRRAFTKPELVEYAHQASVALEKYRIDWRWAFRWIMVIECI